MNNQNNCMKGAEWFVLCPVASEDAATLRAAPPGGGSNGRSNVQVEMWRAAILNELVEANHCRAGAHPTSKKLFRKLAS